MGKDRTLTRREFQAAALIGLTRKAGRPIAGGFLDDGHVLGHYLRDGNDAPAVQETVKVPVVIVGGGIAGLSAGWRLEKRGFRDFVLLEMLKQPGGNSRWGQNEVSAYPYAAHYVPVPNKEAELVRELFEELGVLKDGVWDERVLCHSPQERLFLHGRWQEGIEPELAATSRDREQFRRFHDQMKELREAKHFRIPMDVGSPALPELDRITFDRWAAQNGYDSPYLRWYLDYCCRDDYGAHSADTSAWAGIHYFAARDHEEKGPLTWPEGNGWVARHLAAKLAPYLRTGVMVHSLIPAGKKVRIAASDTLYECDEVIFAAPTFLAPYLMDNAPAVPITYSPWVTANLTLERLPAENGLPLAWDNVIYQSSSLGYVNARHQSFATHINQSVWTWYWAMADGEPREVRRQMLKSEFSDWTSRILEDLAVAHPDLGDCVARVDVLRLGHAMARPAPGLLSSPGLRELRKPLGNVHFANSDLSGLSIFEEAQYRGVVAADRVLGKLGR
jgi:glycine/D-amino acid oxidase-like deaminating enzyme